MLTLVQGSIERIYLQGFKSVTEVVCWVLAQLVGRIFGGCGIGWAEFYRWNSPISIVASVCGQLCQVLRCFIGFVFNGLEEFLRFRGLDRFCGGLRERLAAAHS